MITADLGADGGGDPAARSMPKMNMVTVSGSRNRPDWMMLAPNP